MGELNPKKIQIGARLPVTCFRTALKSTPDEIGERRFHQLVVVGEPFLLESLELLGFGVGARSLGQQGAAVLVGFDRDLIGTDAPRGIDGLLLVGADQRID